MAPWRLLLCLGLLTISPLPAKADPGDAIGAAITVVNLVTGEYNSNLRNLATGDDVRQEEVIAVGDDFGELMLRDQTKVALGPGARLTLDRFVYNPNVTTGSIVLNLVKGGFRFITGVAAKPIYLIRTPVAAISVRGTVFDVYVEGDEAIWILLHEGAVTVCNNAGKCRELNDPCRVLRIGRGGDMPEPGTWNALPYARDVAFDTAFPFVVKPPSIDSHPIFSREDIEGLAAALNRRYARPIMSPKRDRRSIRQHLHGCAPIGSPAIAAIQGRAPRCRTSQLELGSAVSVGTTEAGTTATEPER